MMHEPNHSTLSFDANRSFVFLSTLHGGWCHVLVAVALLSGTCWWGGGEQLQGWHGCRVRHLLELEGTGLEI